MGKDRTWVLAEEYDTKILIPLLVVVFRLFSLDDGNLLPQEPNLVLDGSLFGVITSIEETNEILLKFKLCLFCHIVVLEEGMKSCLLSGRNMNFNSQMLGLTWCDKSLEFWKAKLRSKTFLHYWCFGQLKVLLVGSS
jgi:hypothetical protein